MVVYFCCSRGCLKMVRGVLRWLFIFPVQGAVLRQLDMLSYLWGPHHPFYGPQCTCALCYSLTLQLTDIILIMADFPILLSTSGKVFMLCNKISFIHSLSFHLAKYYRILVYILYYFTYFIVDNTKYEEYWSSFKSVFITCLNSAKF